MSYGRKLKALYNALPKVDIPCPSGCVDCCTTPLVPWSMIEVETVYSATRQYPEILENGTCNFAIDGKCSVYEYRPFMCRLFGLSDTKGFHHCEKGLRTTTPLTTEKVYELLDRYRSLVDKTGGTILPIGGEPYVEELQRLMPGKKIQVLHKPKSYKSDSQALHRLRSLMVMSLASTMSGCNPYQTRPFHY